ncbi:unnamed protein product, partial [Iphiclides podalirius]
MITAFPPIDGVQLQADAGPRIVRAKRRGVAWQWRRSGRINGNVVPNKMRDYYVFREIRYNHPGQWRRQRSLGCSRW